MDGRAGKESSINDISYMIGICDAFPSLVSTKFTYPSSLFHQLSTPLTSVLMSFMDGP